MKYCKADDSVYGEVVFFVDPPTKNVICSIDGEDNHNLLSYEGIKDGVMAHPKHVSHFDLWFNNQYDQTTIKNLLRLRYASAESFKPKEEEIEEKYCNWMKQAVTGLISKDSKTLGISADLIGRCDILNICNFFLKNALANPDTNVLVNGKDFGNIEAMFGRQENPKMVVTAQEDDAQVLSLINNYKSGNPDLQREAGDAIIMKYDKQLRGLLNAAMRQHQQRIDLEDPNYMDKLQTLYTYFLERLKEFDPTKAKVTTFIQSNVALIIKNMFNSNRSKIDKHTQTVGPSSTNGDGEQDDMTFDDPKNLNRHRDRSVNQEDVYDNTEFVNNVMQTSLDPKLYNIMKKYYYDGKTYDQISKEEGVSIERIRQLINMALEKLRLNPEVQQMSPSAYKKVECMKVAMLFKHKDE
jgi:RNA polymerase sigma factor (sigma-70 family)